MSCFTLIADSSNPYITSAATIMRERPVEFACFLVESSWCHTALVDPCDRRYLGEIAGGKNLIGVFKVGVSQCLFDHGDAFASQERNHALPRDAVEKSAVRLGGVDLAIFCHKHVRGPCLGDIAEHVAHQAILET